jgi:hypothetical protein
MVGILCKSMTLRTIGSASSKTNVHSKREPGVECGPGFLKCGPRSWRTKPAVRGKINDKCKGKLRMPGKERPAASRLVIQNLPRRSLTIGIWAKTRNPPSTTPKGKSQRVSITDSFSAACTLLWKTCTFCSCRSSSCVLLCEMDENGLAFAALEYLDSDRFAATSGFGD